MTAKRTLRAVGPEDKPSAPPKLTVAQAAETGEHRALLVALRSRLAVAVSDKECPPKDLAALSNRLVAVSAELEKLQAAEAEEVELGGGELDDSYDPEAI